MKKQLLSAAACALILGGLVSCQSDDLAYSGEMSQEELSKELEKRFDFSSYKTLPLNLNVSPLECVGLYSVDPEKNPDATPFFKAMVGSDGQYSIDIPFAGHLMGKTVWAKGRNGVMQGTLTDKGLSFISRSRAIEIEGLMGENGLCKALEVASDVYLEPQHYNVNILANQMSDIDIEAVDAEGIEVKIAMIDHGDQHKVQLYYYYYTDEEADAVKADINFANKFINDKFLMFPTGEDGYKYEWMTSGENSLEYIGKSFQLKYYGADLNGAGDDKFPPGTHIGFILRSREHTDDNEWLKLTTGNAFKATGDKKIETNYAAAMGIKTLLQDAIRYPAFETIANDPKLSHFIYTFEDATEGGDWDMNDVKFLALVKGDIKPNIPDIPTASGHFKGYYCFEDLYPDQAGGDYDMNDVVVSYDYFYILGPAKTADANREKVIYFDYTITPFHDGATYINDFALKYKKTPSDMRTEDGEKLIYENHSLQFPEKKPYTGYAAAVFDPLSGRYGDRSSDSDSFAKGIIFASSTNILGPIQYKEGDHTSYAGINPYIICRTTGEEVHLTKFPRSGAGSTLLDHYLTTNITNDKNDGTYRYCPFAIDIPSVDGSKFTPTPESVPIYKAFPRFVQWVESDGKEATDWYADTPLGAE